MFKINDDKSIYITRGDVASIDISALKPGQVPYEFQPGDIVRFKVFKRKDCHCVEMVVDTAVEEPTLVVVVNLTSEDTKIGEIISKPVNYWYEVELNPDTEPQTIVGYDEDGEKLFRLFPEGSDVNV